MDGARDQLLSRPGFPQDQHGRIGGSNHFHLSHNPLQSRASADNLLKVVVPAASSSTFSGRSRSRRILTNVIQRNGESFNTASATRTRTRVPSLRMYSFSKGVQAPNRKPSSCASSSRGKYSGGSEIRPVQPARSQVFAAVSDQFEKRVVRLRNLVKLAGNDAGNGRFLARSLLSSRSTPPRRNFSSARDAR